MEVGDRVGGAGEREGPATTLADDGQAFILPTIVSGNIKTWTSLTPRLLPPRRNHLASAGAT